MLKLIVRQRVNIVSADLPGPHAPLYFAGAKLFEVFPLLNLLGTESLGVGALSYAGQFNVMVVGDAEAYPDVDVFAASMRDDLSALIESTANVRGRRTRPWRPQVLAHLIIGGSSDPLVASVRAAVAVRRACDGAARCGRPAP